MEKNEVTLSLTEDEAALIAACFSFSLLTILGKNTTREIAIIAYLVPFCNIKEVAEELDKLKF